MASDFWFGAGIGFACGLFVMAAIVVYAIDHTIGEYPHENINRSEP